jgi:tetratricopeptide (TPR) repeat protein
MKKQILFFYLCLLLNVPVLAQNPENNKILRGKVLFQNSNFTPATGVAISGIIKVEKEEYANKNYTDSKGQYELKFPLARKGHPVKLTLGKEDSKGQELEVVNEKEVSLCVIRANANQEFMIIVCPKGARDLAARKYYKILKSSAEKAYAKMQKELRALNSSQSTDYKSIQQIANELDKLQNQLNDSIAIYKEAMAIASINKDGANRRVLKYLKLLDEGKSIQEARKALSIPMASIDMENGIKQFRAGAKELEERARASATLFDYKDAVICYDTLIAKAEKLNIAPLELSGYYLEAGSYNQDAGYYQKALKNNEKVVAIREKLLDSLDTNLAVSYNNLATIYQNLGRYEEALTAQQQAFKIRETVLEPTHPSLATSYNNLASIYRSLGRYEEALATQQQALKILEAVLEPTHPDLATSYNNLALIYGDLGRYEEALTAQQQALKIREAVLEPTHPTLATSYNNLASIYQALGRYEEALTAQQQALKILEAVLEPTHPTLATSYNNLASIYRSLGRYKEALATQQQALKILEAVLEPTHPDLATSYNNLALIYGDLGRYEEALTAQKQALKIREAVLEPTHPSLATSYNNLGILYYSMKKLPQSIHYLNKAWIIRKMSISEKHPDTQHTFKNLMFVQKEYGTQLFLKGNYNKALKSLDTVTKYQKDAEAWNDKGLCHYYLKQYPKAISAYNKSVEIDSNLKKQHYYNNIGTAYVKNHQFPEAKAAFTQYQKLYPKEGRPYRNWAMYYALQNQKEEALENLEKAIAQGYKDLQWLETDDSMEGLRNEPRFKVLLEKLRE